MNKKMKNLTVVIISGILLIAMSWNNLNAIRLASVIFLGLIIFISYKFAIGDAVVLNSVGGKDGE